MTRNPDLATALPEASIAISQVMIDEYASLSGDFNPIHVDPSAAAATPFGGTIAHGCIPMEPIFRGVQALLGQPVLPAGSGMNLRYHRPSRPGDIITLERVPSEEPDPGRIGFTCRNQKGEIVIDGVFLIDARAG